MAAVYARHRLMTGDRVRPPELPVRRPPPGPEAAGRADPGAARLPLVSDPDEHVGGTSQPGETDEERINRNLNELLGELRVAIPGVQVLFAFLLTVPFTQRFHQLPDRARDVYFAAVTFVACASILLMAPTVHHRVRFRRGTKEQMIRTANRFAVGGM